MDKGLKEKIAEVVVGVTVLATIMGSALFGLYRGIEGARESGVYQTLARENTIRHCKQLNCGELEKLTKDCYRKNEIRD